jgi:HSP90 family molecular chaperone
VEDTPALAKSVAEPKNTEASTTLKTKGRKTASKDIVTAAVVIQKQNMKESKKAEDNQAAQVQCVQHIWTRKPDEIELGEYDKFYESITKDKN